MTLPDIALILRIRAGDGDAASVLVRRYYDDCWRYAYRMTGHRADAEDAVQETFFRALRALARYEERQQFRAWLFVILANRCRTLLVRRRRAIRLASDESVARRLADVREPEEPREPRHPPDVLADALQHALDALGSRYREAFLLKHAEGLEYAQMAEITGASVSALKMRVKRAREILRPLLEERLHEQ